MRTRGLSSIRTTDRGGSGDRLFSSLFRAGPMRRCERAIQPRWRFASATVGALRRSGKNGAVRGALGNFEERGFTWDFRGSSFSFRPWTPPPGSEIMQPQVPRDVQLFEQSVRFDNATRDSPPMNPAEVAALRRDSCCFSSGLQSGWSTRTGCPIDQIPPTSVCLRELCTSGSGAALAQRLLLPLRSI